MSHRFFCCFSKKKSVNKALLKDISNRSHAVEVQSKASANGAVSMSEADTKQKIQANIFVYIRLSGYDNDYKVNLKVNIKDLDHAFDLISRQLANYIPFSAHIIRCSNGYLVSEPIPICVESMILDFKTDKGASFHQKFELIDVSKVFSNYRLFEKMAMLTVQVPSSDSDDIVEDKKRRQIRC